MSIRVRYAPSPTGLQHIGGVRTALFNYFFARSQKGKFILRIEDTDRTRYSEEALEDLYATFRWLGIHWDEGPDLGGPYGPYVQSERVELYKRYAEELVEKGAAYRCFCTSERLEKLREEQEKTKGAQGYDRHCRDLSPRDVEENLNRGMPWVIRFKIPMEGSTAFYDELLGPVERKNTDINPDPVLLKSDGFPTYHLANIVDDHLMEITHILRAQEWLPSGNLHVLLYKAFGWEPPKYCHLPMVMGTDGQKLSKRHGATSVKEFRNSGYLPEALINYVALVGWHYDDSRELFSKEELEALFSLEKLSKSPGIFDYKKLEWYNGVYIRQKTDKELAETLVPILNKAGLISCEPDSEEQRILYEIIPLLKERLKFLTDASEQARFFFLEPEDYPPGELIPKKFDQEKTIAALSLLSELVETFFGLTDEEGEVLFKERAEKMDIKLGDLLLPLRVALTGSRVSPPLFGSLRVLGKEKSLKRIKYAQELIRKYRE